MKKLAIIGGGIIGLTLANYIDLTKYSVTVYDNPVGQATKASAGIISPWLSKRRNKKWYQLAKDGAAFYPKLVRDFSLSNNVYQQTGTLILRKDGELDALMQLAEERKQHAPEIGDIQLLTGEQVVEKLPLLKVQSALFITGGGKLDGASYLETLRQRAQENMIVLKTGTAMLSQRHDQWLVQIADETEQFDAVALCTGPGLPSLLASIDFKTDIRAQKGQLLAFETPFKDSGSWPVAMLDGESDLIPFEKGQILVGATHENDGGFDLTPTKEAFSLLQQKTVPFLAESTFFEKYQSTYRVGTRAYTSDFAPFFNFLPNNPTAVIASGLGSSGLTTGPYIGFLLAKYFNEGKNDWEYYQKPIEHYLSKL
ncbi:FAD-binding oxidoreductase [Enterococcus plantarum]|uniref:NAD(P)/FAD-dependent oxidoreductase n=1 Tax=Enterococcus plantarum TaxID=1077675 RepID=UPI001A8ED890|nr:FAD-dependent oxidoreductase [Enterococcus plantarum]MBO0467286.1 FAD-binding oxidoreductase [Enterococcus plantarum]